MVIWPIDHFITGNASCRPYICILAISSVQYLGPVSGTKSGITERTSSLPVPLHIPSHALPSSYIWPGQVTEAQVICVCGGGESEREMFLLFNFPVLITFLLLFFFFFFNSFCVKEVAEIAGLLILVLTLITKLQECIITLRLGGQKMVADGAGTGTSTGTDGDGDTGGNRMDLELQIPVDNSISASVEASMSAGNGVHA